MPQTCSVCKHPKRAAVDSALVAGTPLRNIAEQFGLSTTALFRHRSEHIPDTLARAADQNNVRSALNVVDQLKAINGATLAVLKEARALGDHDMVLKAVDRAHRQIELQAKLLGDLDERPQINLLVSPQWLEIRGQLMDALQPYPTARVAVASRLLELESGWAG